MKVPKSAPDELGYSIISRHAEIWRHRDDLGLWQAWTGMEASHSPMLEVVAGTRTLASFVCPGSKDPQRQFLRQHTLAPYFLAFMGKQNKRTALERLLGEVPSVARSFERSMLPVEARLLSFCPECASLQMRRGFPYWTRTAQLPGLSHCVFHGTVLLMSDITVQMKRSSDGLQPLDRAILDRCRAPRPRLMRRDLEARVAVQSLYAMRQGMARTEAVSVGHYRRRLLHLGYGTNHGTLRAQQLNTEFLHWLRLRKACPADFGPGAWWLRLLTRVGVSVVPLQHLLMDAFISDVARQHRAIQPELSDEDGREIFIDESFPEEFEPLRLVPSVPAQ